MVLAQLTMMMMTDDDAEDDDDDDNNKADDLPDMHKLRDKKKHKEREEYTIQYIFKYPIPPKILRESEKTKDILTIHKT